MFVFVFLRVSDWVNCGAKILHPLPPCQYPKAMYGYKILRKTQCTAIKSSPTHPKSLTAISHLMYGYIPSDVRLYLYTMYGYIKRNVRLYQMRYSGTKSDGTTHTYLPNIKCIFCIHTVTHHSSLFTLHSSLYIHTATTPATAGGVPFSRGEFLGLVRIFGTIFGNLQSVVPLFGRENRQFQKNRSFFQTHNSLIIYISFYIFGENHIFGDFLRKLSLSEIFLYLIATL